MLDTDTQQAVAPGSAPADSPFAAAAAAMAAHSHRHYLGEQQSRQKSEIRKSVFVDGSCLADHLDPSLAVSELAAAARSRRSLAVVAVEERSLDLQQDSYADCLSDSHILPCLVPAGYRC